MSFLGKAMGTLGGDPVVDQGVEAKELGLDEDACPYGEGENRDNWLKGHGKGKAPKTDDK